MMTARNIQQSSVRYGDEQLVFTIEPRQSDAPKVLIKVHPDGSVIAQAPAIASYEEIITAVKKRARWIYRQLRYFEKQRSDILPRHYVSGESHFYLGRRHMLKVSKSDKTKAGVKLLRGVLQVTGKSLTPEQTKLKLHEWYKTRARDVFDRRLEHVLPQALWVKEKPGIRLQAMKTQWGSCSPTGNLTLNPHLVKAQTECIDYVLLHELCHIEEHNHSDRFYRLMKQVMPQWEPVKERLDSMAYFYLNDF